MSHPCAGEVVQGCKLLCLFSLFSPVHVLNPEKKKIITIKIFKGKNFMKCVKKKLDNNKMNKGGKFLKKLWCRICGRE